MIGERGGKTASIDAGIHLIETHKWSTADRVRADILTHLRSHADWHRDDLRVSLSPADKNVLGAVVNGLIRSGLIEETGERRKSSDPASHARKSNVYRLSVGGSGSDREVHPAASSDSKFRRSADSGGPGNSGQVEKCVPAVEPSNDSSVSPLPKTPRPGRIPRDGGRPSQEKEPVGGDTTSPADPLPLFEMDEKRWKDAA